jgi:hypothetical protein
MNRSLATIAVLMVLFIGQSYTHARAEGKAPEILYLHCFCSTSGHQVVVDPHAPKDMTPATPPARLMTLRVNVGIPFEIIDSRTHTISGQVMVDGESHRATLKGSFGSGFKFSGRVELEKVFDTEIAWFSGAVFPCRFVFSKNRDITPFLQLQTEIDVKNLQEATELTRKNHHPGSGLKAEQDGGGQPATRPESK